MNVANRKLFTNRDARAKLSSMGGIMASSPELLGEVQKFAKAGDVKVPMFLVQLPGLIGGNEFLHLTAVELQSLKASQPGLMDQRGVVIQQSTPEILSELNPAQIISTDNPNVQKMFADLGVALPETESSVEVEGSGVLDKFKSMFATKESPFIFSDTTGVSRDGRSNAEILAEAKALIPSQSETTPVTSLPMNTAADSGFEGQVFSGAMGGANMMPPGAPGQRSPQALPERTGLAYLSDVLDRPVTELFNENTDAQNRVSDARRRGEVATDTPAFMDSDAGSEISPEVQKALEVQEQLNKSGGILRGVKGFGAGILEAGNIAAGVPMYVGGQAVAGAADVFGLLGGGGAFSRGAFEFSDDMQDETNRQFLPEGSLFPRLVNSADTSAYNQLLYPTGTPGGLSSEAFQEFESEQLAAQRAQIQAESLAALENADASVFSEGAPTELTPAGRAQRAADSVTRMSEQGMPKGLSPEAIERIQEQQAQETIDRELDAAGQRLVAGQPIEAGPVEVQSTDDSSEPSLTGQILDGVLGKERTDVLRENIERVNERIDSRAARKRAKDAAEYADENVSLQGPNFVPAPEEVATKEKVAPPPSFQIDTTAVIEDIKKGNSGSNPLVSGLTGTKQDLTPKESVKAFQAMYREMLGIEDEDKAKEKWHQMAMIGFAMAAGKSDNALENVAVGLLEGTKMARQDRKDTQTRDDAITMAAIKGSQAENIARIRASSSGADMRNYKSPIDAIQYESSLIAKEIENGTLELKPGQTVQNLAVDRLIPLYTAMGKDVSTFESLGTPSSSGSTSQLSTAADTEAAAKAAGKKEFVWNGTRYPVR